jgi:hypothetical protein
VSKGTFSPALQAGMEDVVRGMATARICRLAITARNLLLNSLQLRPDPVTLAPRSSSGPLPFARSEPLRSAG